MVVCDAGPIIHLDELGCLDLLADFNAILLTDDAAARLVAEQLGMPVHGTIGVVVRAVRRRQRSPQAVLDVLRAIPTKSTLFVRPQLLDAVIDRLIAELGID